MTFIATSVAMGTEECKRASKTGPAPSSRPFQATQHVSIAEVNNSTACFCAQGAALAGHRDGAVHRHVLPFTPSQSHESLSTAARAVIHSSLLRVKRPRNEGAVRGTELRWWQGSALRWEKGSQADHQQVSCFPPRRIDKPKALSLLLHTADISHPSKPWPLHSRWTKALMEEFFRQVGNLTCDCFKDK